MKLPAGHALKRLFLQKLAQRVPSSLLVETLQRRGWGIEQVPAGHYYSATPSVDEIRRDEARIWGPLPDDIPGVDLKRNSQKELLVRLSEYYGQVPWSSDKTQDMRYYFENGWYGYSDAIFLYSMVRHLHPARILEVGSGFSSAAILDVNERFLNSSIKLVCIDPDSSRLRSLIKTADEVEIHEQRVQDIPQEVFQQLCANDILLIDSTHVLKVGSDVAFLLSEVLPRLHRGVHVHFHDVFFPFEYPKQLVFSGRWFNECHALRAFLTFNRCFEIVLFNTYVETIFEDWFKEHMPLCLRNKGGSLWIARTQD